MDLLSIASIGCLALASPAASAQSARGAPAAPPRASHQLARGTVVARDDIAVESLEHPQATRIVGWVTRRVVRAGEPLCEPAIAPPPFVRAGGAVTVSSSLGGVRATRLGTALSDGRFGERIRVRLDPRRSLWGVVAGPGSVRTP